jgi:hypothetical protein
MRPSKSAARSADRRAYRGFPAISSMPGSARCGGALWRTAVTVLFVSLFLLHATEGKERVRRLGDPASAAPAPAGGLSPVDWWSPLWPILLAWGWFVALMSAGTSVRLFGFNQQNARDVVSWCSNHSSREELGMLLTAFWIVLAIMVTVSVPVAGATDFAGKIGAEQAQFCNILALLFSLYAVLLAIAVCYVLKTGGVTAQWRWLWKIISNMVACSATAILFAVLRERDGFTQQPGTNPEKWLNVAETLLSTHGMLAALKWVFEVFCSPELGNRLRENRRIMPDVVTGTPNIAVAILAYCVYTVTVTVLSVISQREAFGVACLMTTSCLFYAVFILIGRVPQPDIGVGWHVVPKNVQRVYLALVLTWCGVRSGPDDYAP